MAKVFAAQNLLAAWARQAAPDGMRPDDVADAMGGILDHQLGERRGAGDAPPSQVRGVRDQLRRTLVTNPGFLRLGQAQRQQMAEVVIYKALIQAQAYEEASRKGDAALKARLAAAAAARFRARWGSTSAPFRSRTEASSNTAEAVDLGIAPAFEAGRAAAGWRGILAGASDVRPAHRLGHAVRRNGRAAPGIRGAVR